MYGSDSTLRSYWQLNYDAPAQPGLFSPEPFPVILSDIIFPLGVYVTQCLQQSSV